MGIIVCKFGGSSVADPAGIFQVENILASNPDRRYIVLSAPGASGDMPKVTDLLEQVWREGGDGSALDQVAARFAGLEKALGLPVHNGRIREILRAAARVSRAHTLSRGEYLCARLFARHSGIPFMDASTLVRFDAAGRLDVPRTLTAIGEAAREHPRLVIPGFYGTDPGGNTVTLPRNGSDITGALVAAGVHASLYENWTDVPGVMTGDPMLNHDARVIPTLSFAQMRALALQGARVLHPDCLEPLQRLGIPISIRCTMDPEAPGTRVE